MLTVTEIFIWSLTDPVHSAKFPFHEILPSQSGTLLSDACVLDDCIAISTHADTRFHTHVFKIDIAGLTVSHVQTKEVDGDVTCLSLGAGYAILAGIWREGRPFLLRSFLPSGEREVIDIRQGRSPYRTIQGWDSSAYRCIWH